MNPLTKNLLNEKLVKTIEHLKTVEADKALVVASYRDQIKAARKRIDAMAEAIEKQDLAPLQSVFDPIEIRTFQQAGSNKDIFEVVNQ